eukprot:gene1788-2122_t
MPAEAGSTVVAAAVAGGQAVAGAVDMPSLTPVTGQPSIAASVAPPAAAVPGQAVAEMRSLSCANDLSAAASVKGDVRAGDDLAGGGSTKDLPRGSVANDLAVGGNAIDPADTDDMADAPFVVHAAARLAVPGEILLSGAHWVPDMQLRCWQGAHIAVAVMAVMIGVPSLLGYWLLLLVLSWPVAADGSGGGAAHGSAAGGAQTQPAAAAAVRRRRGTAGKTSQKFFALLVVLLTTQGVDGAVFGGVLLGLLLVLVGQVLLVLFGLSYRCLSAGKQMSLFQQGLAAAGLA